MRSRIGVSPWLYAGALVCAAAAAPETVAIHHAKRIRSATDGAGIASSRLPARDSRGDFTAGRVLNGRALYPYSVIPGGAENAEELKEAVQRDPVVAAHYSNFNVAEARVVRAEADRAVYVSYRIGERVFWTSKTLTIHEGETLLSDGVHEARTRCGNQLSNTPVMPVSPEEPSEKALAPPEAPVLYTGNTPEPVLPPVIPPGAPPAPPTTGTVIPPPVFPIVGGGPPGPHPNTPPPPPPPPPPPVNVPEPGSALLLAAGLSSLAAIKLLPAIHRRRQQRNPSK